MLKQGTAKGTLVNHSENNLALSCSTIGCLLVHSTLDVEVIFSAQYIGKGVGRLILCARHFAYLLFNPHSIP